MFYVFIGFVSSFCVFLFMTFIKRSTGKSKSKELPSHIQKKMELHRDVAVFGKEYDDDGLKKVGVGDDLDEVISDYNSQHRSKHKRKNAWKVRDSSNEVYIKIR